MPITYLTSFDMGSLAAEGTVTGTPTASAVNVHSGGYAYRSTWSGVVAPASNVALASSTGTGTARALFKSYACWAYLANSLVVDHAPVIGGAVNIATRYTLTLTPVSPSNIDVRVWLNNSAVLTVGSAVPPSSWHVYEVDIGYNAGTGVRLYIDGVLAGSAPASGTVAADTVGVVGRNFAANFTSTGELAIDDVIFWDGSDRKSVV